MLCGAFLRGGEAPVLADRSGRQLLASAHLVPADERLAVLGGECGGAGDEGEEVLVGRREGLVPAEVDVRARRQLDDLAHDVVEEFVGAVVRDAERAEPDLDSLVGCRRDAIAVELWVGRERSVGVAGHIDLRNDRDVLRCGVLDDLAVVGLRVEAAAPAVHLGARPDLGERRPGVDLQAPALVVGEVQVQVVELQKGDVVDVALDRCDAEEVAGDVQHRSAVLEPWVVGDAGDLRRVVNR